MKKTPYSNIFSTHSIRYAVDGDALTDAREEQGFNQSSFAALCGWSPTYQWKLENGEVESVCQETVDIIMRSLKGTIL